MSYVPVVDSQISLTIGLHSLELIEEKNFRELSSCPIGACHHLHKHPETTDNLTVWIIKAKL